MCVYISVYMVCFIKLKGIRLLRVVIFSVTIKRENVQYMYNAFY